MRLFNFTKSIILSLFLLSSNTLFAAIEGGVINIEHCFNCDTLLVGAANVFPNSIQWVGSQEGSIYLNAELNEYGFTGWQKTYHSSIDNLWNLDTSTRLILANAKANGAAPPIGFFFAPSSEGRESSSIEYTVATIGKITKLVNGSGIADNNSSITLQVEINLSNGAIQQVSCGAGCQEVAIPRGGRVIFNITPNINQDAVRQLGLNPDSHNNVLINLIATEKNTGCSSTTFAFEDRGMKPTKALSTDKNNYYDFLGIAGPDAMLPNCERHYSFLRSSGKSFEFYANNKRDTNEGYIEYVFFVEGHYIPFNKQKWAGISHQTFRIRTSNDIITTREEPPIAIINATPSTGEAPLKVTLDASSSSDSDGNIISYEWSSDGVFMSSKEAPPVHTFSQVGTYTIGLKVTDNTGLTDFTQKQITVLATEEIPEIIDPTNKKPVATFSVKRNGLVMTLDGSNSNDTDGSIISYSWNANGGEIISSEAKQTQIIFPDAGTYTIILKVVDNNGATDTYQETFTISAQSQPPIADFSIIYDDAINLRDGNNPRYLTLNPAASTDIDGNIELYEWRITDVNSNTDIDVPDNNGKITIPLPGDGKYVVELVVTDDSGYKDVTSKIITLPRLFASFDINFVGLHTITVDAKDSIAPIDSEITDYWWRVDYQNKKIANSAKPEPIELQQPGQDEYVITLVITDSNGRMASASRIVKYLDEFLPLLGEGVDSGKGILLGPDGTVDTQAIFKGGILINNEFFTGEKFNVATLVSIVANVTIDPKHVGMEAEPLIIMRVGPANNPDLQDWYMKTLNVTVEQPAPFIPWDLKPVNIVAADEKDILNQTLDIDIFSGSLYDAFSQFPRDLSQPQTIWVGYRITSGIDNGKIVFNETPIVYQVWDSTILKASDL
ncbi:MAG TPA: PKD domain-containing protein [Thioploca sp.]|nr:PKD domain-containing protein [Thioploca sp.]